MSVNETLTNDQTMLNETLLTLMKLEEDIEVSLKRNNYDDNPKKCEYLMKLHKALMKASRITLKIKAIENYGEDYNED